MHPHFELVNLLRMFFLVLTLALVFKIGLSVRSSLTPRYKGFGWYSSGVPDQETLSGRFASLFLRWDAHT